MLALRKRKRDSRERFRVFRGACAPPPRFALCGCNRAINSPVRIDCVDRNWQRDHVFLTSASGFRDWRGAMREPTCAVEAMTRRNSPGVFHHATISNWRRDASKEETDMITKTKTALVAALVLSAASAASAVEVSANADRDRGFTTYQATVVAQLPRGQQIEYGLIEGRNVGVELQNFVPSDQKHWYDRNSIDFNS
jgi:hypothetical protein